MDEQEINASVGGALENLAREVPSGMWLEEVHVLDGLTPQGVKVTLCGPVWWVRELRPNAGAQLHGIRMTAVAPRAEGVREVVHTDAERIALGVQAAEHRRWADLARSTPLPAPGGWPMQAPTGLPQNAPQGELVNVQTSTPTWTVIAGPGVEPPAQPGNGAGT